MFYFSNARKSFFKILIGIFIFVQLFGVLAFAKPVQAQMDSAITAAFTGKWTWEQAGNSLLAASLGALVNGMSYFMRKMAYDAAMYVAAGGKGQGALAFNVGPAKYFENVALDSAASAIEVLGEPFGLNLCQTPDLRIQVYLQVGLRNMYGDKGGGENGPQPRCDWNKLSNSWSGDAFESKYGPGGRKFLAETFTNALRVENTDFGIALGAMGKLDRIKANAEAGAAAERIEGQGYKALTGLISGKIKTPAQIIKTETEAITAKNQTDLSAKQIAGIYGSGALQIIPMGASVFINTLTSQLLNKLMNAAQGLFSDDASEEDGAGASDFFAQYVQSSRKAAAQAFNFLYTAVPQKQLNTYNVVAEFLSCPSEGRSLNNCVIDSNLQTAIERARTGEPITIQQALDDGLLNESGLLISPRREVDNTNLEGCVDGKKYCYSNLQKLRKVRIFPLGFELAALKSDPDQPWTLKQVVDGFESCDRNKDGEAVASPAFPFCHLIDPNWIIRSPEAHCEAKVNGPMLESADTARRQTECVDISTCLAENAKGTCTTPFSYCLKEKNIWRLGGETCPSYYSTCDTYFDKTGKAVSYLSRTLDYGECNLDSVGCRAYSLEKGTGDDWKNSEQINLANKYLSRPQTIFFNKNIDNYRCNNAKDEGCSAFNSVGADNSRGSLNYLKKAPDYLGCYDIDISTGSTEINWPKTKVELAVLNDRPESCKNFAGVCLPEELGCESYTSSAGGVAVPGIVGENYCKAECVGYDTYKEEATYFSSSSFPLHFIPNNGQKCQAQDKGCAEFTNIDDVTKGGEGLEYYTDLRYCERPTTDNQKTFYSWEGSATEGYVLRTHKLLPITETKAGIISEYGLANLTDSFVKDSPAYVDDSVEALEKNYGLCNAVNYNVLINNPYSNGRANPDCRALYNDAGAVYYRLLLETVTVSEACHPLRKTESELFVDTHISTANCTKAEVGGKLNDNGQCLRCYRGGKLDDSDSACIYWTISQPGEAVSCSSPAAKNCRAYTGNTGNNIKEILFNRQKIATFEPTGTEAGALVTAGNGWDGTNVQVRPESIQVGQYSLGVQGNVTYEFASSTIETNSWYKLNFWAKGAMQTLRVKFSAKNDSGAFVDAGEFTFNPYTQTSVPVTVGAGWQEYSLGPILFTGNGSKEVRLTISGEGNGQQYYLDNIWLTQLQDQTYLIKNSWKTQVEDPLGSGQFITADVLTSCDAEPKDGLPGVALGCKAYTDSHGTKINATGFEKLCRPEAVGCQEFYDTFNTPDETTTSSYKVWCSGTSGSVCKLTVADTELGKCSVPVGGSGCFVDKVVVPQGVAFPTGITNAEVVTSTIIIPADTPIGQPIYLTNRKDFACTESSLGCTKVALESKTVLGLNGSASLYDFSESYIKNNPANYAETLCNDSLVGCQEFKSGNEITYFKNPEILGSVQCSYKTLTEDNGTKYSGWYRDGIGKCGITTNLCRVDDDCDTGIKCNLNEPVPCYENYLQTGSNYGIWSNSSDNYQGLVGMCPASESGCTELIDTADTSQIHPVGKPYYVIYNQDVEKRAGECEGKVSQKEGCVLFDRTDIPNKVFNVKETYLNSKNLAGENKYGLVSPVIVPTANEPRLTANLILKVERDRQCSEWLQCESYAVNYDEKGKPTNLCEEFKRCRELNDRGECISWVSPNDDLNFETLTEDYYVQRPTSWYAEDFSGYSLLNKYQIGSYTNIKTGLPSDPTYLAHIIDDRVRPDEGKGCEVTAPAKPEDINGQDCGLGDDGRCWNGRCIYPLDGAFPTETNEKTLFSYLEQGSCKAYPEKDSPFEVFQATESVGSASDKKPLISEAIGSVGKFRWNYPGRVEDYGKVNVCQEIGDNKCSCNYVKVTYKNSVADYWPANNDIESKIPLGVCAGGAKDGVPCNPDTGDKDQCGLATENPGTCNRITERTQRRGQTGYCLEYDLSRPIGRADTDFKKQNYACLTWLPVEVSASGIDTYNYFDKAGYLPGLDAIASPGQVYCTESTANGQFTYDTMQYQDLSSILRSKCNFIRSGSITSGEDVGANSYTMSGQGIINLNYRFSSSCGSSPETMNIGKKFEKQLFDGFSTVMPGVDYNRSTATKFGWLGIKENFDKGYVTPQNVYTFMQLFGWYGVSPYLSNVDKSTTESDVIVWYIKNPFWWVDTLKQLTVTGWNVDTLLEHPSSSYSYDLNKTIYLDEVRRVYLPSFAFYYDSAWIGASADHNMVFTDDIYIDFERLRNIEKKDRNQEDCNEAIETCIAVEERKAVYSLKEVIGEHNEGIIGAEDNEKFTYFTYYGQKPNGTEVYGIYLLSKEYTDKSSAFKAMVWQIDGKNQGDIWPDGDLKGRYLIEWEINNGKLSKPTSEGYLSIDDSLKDDEGYFDCTITTRGVSNCEIQKASYLGALIELIPRCTAFNLVHKVQSDDDYDTLNKAWTNRVWANGADNYVFDSVGDKYFKRDGGGTSVPYGATSLYENDLNDKTILRKYLYNDSVISGGFPFACYDKLFSGANFDLAVASTRSSDWSAKIYCNSLLGHLSELQSFKSAIEKFPAQAQEKYLNNEYTMIKGFVGAKALTRLFAKSFEVKYRSASSGNEADFVSFVGGTDNSGDLSIANKYFSDTAGTEVTLYPPRIYSLNPDNCKPGLTSVPCTYGEENNITVGTKNGTLTDYNRDGYEGDEDTTGDGKPEYNYGINSYLASIKFYALADENRMPIKRVMVDWGDRSEPDPKIGMYKNHLPFCSDDGATETRNFCKLNGVNTQLTCNTVEDCPVEPGKEYFCNNDKNPHFGSAVRACETNIFERVHNYTCTDLDKDAVWHHDYETLEPGEKQKLQQMGVSPKFVCIFQPRVQVLDNWGWCNGTCGDLAANGGNNNGIIDGSEFEGCYNNTDPTALDLQCDQGVFDIYNDEHWTKYQGKIIVIPKG